MCRREHKAVDCFDGVTVQFGETVGVRDRIAYTDGAEKLSAFHYVKPREQILIKGETTNRGWPPRFQRRTR